MNEVRFAVVKVSYNLFFSLTEVNYFTSGKRKINEGFQIWRRQHQQCG